jgi:hypothetical protein
MSHHLHFRALPQVPTTVDPQTRLFLSALKENFEILAGMRGSDPVVPGLLGYTPVSKDGDSINGSLTVSGTVGIGSQPAFAANGTGTQSWSGTTTPAKLDMSGGTQGIAAPKSDGWVQADSRFTAVESGTYVFVMTLTVSATPSAGPAMLLYKNGTQVREMGLQYAANAFTVATGIAVIDALAGDYFEPWVSNNNNTSFTIDRSRCGFSGFRLS